MTDTQMRPHPMVIDARQVAVERSPDPSRGYDSRSARRACATRLLALHRGEPVPDALLAELSAEGFGIRCADADRVHAAVPQLKPTCVLLHALPTGPSGLKLCRELRSQSDVPIIVLSSNDSRLDGVVWLRSGADDYIARPLHAAEVLERVRAVLRRRYIDLSRAQPVRRLGELAIDYRHQRVCLRGAPVALTATEFRILSFLAEEPGHVRSRREILEHLNHGVHVGDERVCDVHISHLRRKIDDDPAGAKRIVTVRGAGYLLASRLP